jgi:3-(3-hydroxy-phenyl)propionate hydroxylase
MRFALLKLGNNGGIELPSGVSTIRIGGENGFWDREGLAAARYDAQAGAAYLLRPDGYVAARFRKPSREALEAALSRASGIN